MIGVWLWPALGLLSAIAIFSDARRLGIRYGGPTGRDGSVGAPGWAGLALVMPIPTVPLYLWRRRRCVARG